MSYTSEIDIPSAKERFMGNEAMYKKFLYQLPEKNMLGELDEKLAASDAQEAFKVAHTLKGLAGNLSLNHLMEVIGDVVEPLRGGDFPSKEALDTLKEVYEQAVAAIDEVKEQDIALF